VLYNFGLQKSQNTCPQFKKKIVFLFKISKQTAQAYSRLINFFSLYFEYNIKIEPIV